MSENSSTTVFPVFNFTEGEVLIINKPYNWTSFDVVGKLRNSFKPLKLKVGHAGTLDPLATGLLILCTGKLTKQIETYQAEEKEYTGTFTLGATTPSYDLETEIDQTFNISELNENAILENCKHFIGDLNQFGTVKSLWTTSPIDQILNKTMPLKPSGLMGPIQLVEYKIEYK